MRLRVLAYYHDAMGQLVELGLKPTAVHRCLCEEGVRVSLSAVKQYLGRYSPFPPAKKLFIGGIQKPLSSLAGAVSAPPQPSAPLGAGADRPPLTQHRHSKSLKALKEYLPIVPEAEPVESNADSFPFCNKEWWGGLRDIAGAPLFLKTDRGWRYSGGAPDLSNVGLYACIGAHLYARSEFPEEIRRDLQRISMQIVAKVTLNLTQKMLDGKILFGFVPTFAKRDRGMNEWQSFQKLPRWWRRKIIVEGTLGGYFLPLSMAWSGEASMGDATADLPPEEPEYVLPDEYTDSSRQKLVPQEYLDLLGNKERLTEKLYWKTF